MQSTNASSHMISYSEIKKNDELAIYVEKGNEMLGILGFTDHSAAHTVKVGESAAKLLEQLGFPQEDQENAKIAGYIHDIGNMVNRVEHAQTGAIMAFVLLSKMGMNPLQLATIVAAIGNHDEDTGLPISSVSAAIIIADKTDVRRTRVRNRDLATFDIHDRVNYAVVKSNLIVEGQDITLYITIETEICSVMDYFEIFLSRMIMCKRAASFLGANFKLNINNSMLL